MTHDINKEKRLNRKNQAKELKDTLTDSLTYKESDNLEDILAQQSKALDLIFKRLLSDADDQFDPVPRYNTALRAQSLFRSTAKALLDVKDREKQRIDKLDNPFLPPNEYRR